MNFLAGDLGGTKTLLAIFSWDGTLSISYQKHYLSKDWSSLNQIIAHFLDSLPKNLNEPSHGCIAVAGPVTNGQSRITNLGWDLDEKEICKFTKLKTLELINDFSVLIYGLPYLNRDQYSPIQPISEVKPIEGTVAIIGAGTGLGVTTGLITRNEIKVFPSEGGHCEFAARTEREWQLAQWLKNDLKIERLSRERVISGTGLGHVARWRLTQHDANNHPLNKTAEVWRYSTLKTPDFPAIVSKAAKNGDPIMKEALELWLGAYGSAAGDLVLQELCLAGLWISGGTASKQLTNLRSSSFLDAMQNKGRFKEFIQKIPVMALTDPSVGLFSAACRARLLAESSGTLS